MVDHLAMIGGGVAPTSAHILVEVVVLVVVLPALAAELEESEPCDRLAGA